MSIPAKTTIGHLHRSLTELAADQLVELIIETGLGEGDTIPTAADLCRRFGVSLPVVREAIATLAGRGILRRRQGREPTVAIPREEVIGSILRIHARLLGVPAEDFQETRLGIEIQAAELAATRTDLDTKKLRLERPLAGMAAARTDDELHEHDLAFHRAVAELSENKATYVVLASLHQITHDMMQHMFSRSRQVHGPRAFPRAVNLHRRIADAIYARDAVAARDAVTAHFGDGFAMLRSGARVRAKGGTRSKVRRST